MYMHRSPVSCGHAYIFAILDLSVIESLSVADKKFLDFLAKNNRSNEKRM